ncbi:MAG: hypothetical protein AB7U49_14275 [Hyphomicrobiaceae bacterium]
MCTRAITLVSTLAIVPFGLVTAAAQSQHPNPNALLNQWLESNQQENIDAALRSAKAHAVKGEKDAAIADYRKVLALSPKHPDAVAGLKALGLDDASIASPLKLLPPNARSNASAPSPSPFPATGGGGGGGILGGGLY